MGAGMHGLNGVHPEVGIRLWNVYAVPRLVYGLEILRLQIGNWSKVELCQRQILRNILHLPSSTAIPAIHLISGVLPVQAIVERNALMLFRNFLSSKDTKEWNIIERQLAIKSNNSRSWVVYIKNLLSKYNLPSAYLLKDDTPTKFKWKALVKRTLNRHWIDKLRDEARQMSSLKFLCVDRCSAGTMHPVWRKTPYNKVAILQANVRAKILVGRYFLQDDLNKFKGTEYPCPMCMKEPEDLNHFLYRCDALESERARYIPVLGRLTTQASSALNWRRVMADSELKLQLLIDPDSPNLALDPTATYDMVYALHSSRAALMKDKE